ncbi:MAG: hypothetical protein [Bacteriophage sp.]|nr:MAG: hypothetical protein [Bacteriophage sp.]
MAQPLTYQEIYNRFKTCRINDSYILLTPNDPNNPIRSRTEVIIKHKKCGNTLSTRFQHFVNDGKGKCKICYPDKKGHSTAKVSLEEMIKRVQEKHSSVQYKDGFVSMNKKCNFIHTECGTEYSVIPRDLIRGTIGCSVCANKNVRGKYISSNTYLDDIIEDEYEWLEAYKGDNKLKHKIKHLKCGTEYEVRPNDFQQGYRCPECTNCPLPSTSRNAKRIENYLIKHGFPFKKEFIDKRCKSDKGGQLRFDFAIEYGDQLLIIEYDGEFHSSKEQNEKVAKQFTKNLTLSETIRRNTIRRDKIKNKFIKDHPEDYIALYRITHEQPIIKTLEKILNKYFDY